jgi:transposase
MVNAKLEAQRQTILHYWLNGTRSATEIHKKTSIPLRTVERNIKKLKETGTVEHKRGNGRHSKVTQRVAAAIGQHVRHNSAISTRQIAVKVQETQGISISHQAIWLNMKKRVRKFCTPWNTNAYRKAY